VSRKNYKKVRNRKQITPQLHLRSLLTVKKLIVVSHTVYAHIGGSKNSGDTWTPPLRMGACLTYRNMPLPNMCHRNKFGL